MTTYISILRAINVGGQKAIKMDTLKSLYEDLGFENVRTYIQSGNVVFVSQERNPKDLEAIISSKIQTDFGFEVPVLVLNLETFAAIVENNPFMKGTAKDAAFLHVTFLASSPADFDMEKVLEKKQAGEEIAFTKNAVYLYCPNGYGKTKWHNTFLENKLKAAATTRNWKTTQEILRLAQA